MKPHVITGGPCVGKTTVITLLKERGYNTVQEASRSVIQEETEKGSGIVPWKNVGEFQKLVANRQMEYEKNIPDSVNFLDRSIIDGHAYTEINNLPALEIIEKNARNRYDKIFILEPLTDYVTDASRVEDGEMAVAIHEGIRKAYIFFGYEPISVPLADPEKRVDFILSHLGQ